MRKSIATASDGRIVWHRQRHDPQRRRTKLSSVIEGLIKELKERRFARTNRNQLNEDVANHLTKEWRLS
jgi:hypothetical protein